MIGTALAYRALWTVTSALAMQAWPSVPATLQHVELKTHARGSQSASASYVYFVNGQKFSGKRVSLYGADNFGSFQERANDALQSYLARRRPTRFT